MEQWVEGQGSNYYGLWRSVPVGKEETTTADNSEGVVSEEHTAGRSGHRHVGTGAGDEEGRWKRDPKKPSLTVSKEVSSTVEDMSWRAEGRVTRKLLLWYK